MAEIRLCSLKKTGMGSPEIPGEIDAFVKRREWPGGGTVPVLVLWVGLDALEIWPADHERIRQLGQKLIAISDEVQGAGRGA